MRPSIMQEMQITSLNFQVLFQFCLVFFSPKNFASRALRNKQVNSPYGLINGLENKNILSKLFQQILSSLIFLATLQVTP